MLNKAAANNDKKDWTISDLISLGMLIVTTFLAFFTFQLYNTAVKDSRTADTSAKAAVFAAIIAKQTFDATKRYNDSSLAIQQKVFGETKEYNTGSFDIQKRAFEGSSLDSKERFKRDTTALGLQIQSLKQNQKQFIKQNEPYLQVYIDSISINKSIINYKRADIFYTLVNLTPIPVKIISQKGNEIFSFKPPVNISNAPLVDAGDINYYVIKESPQNRKLTITTNLYEEDIKNIMEGKWSTYWIDEISYENLISGKIKTYKFSVKITRFNNRGTYSEFINNDNSEEK
ncbi:hypothetical protein [uncultured Mucilaginibacter sp.]|uniref:hypothetical protein n=1 Tax=uncultured Mucilaginibacter sp. TaxID=797541 RepID=UPI0025D1955F|nr:hypothetical protein [uncultured Mucilaginibacter sp.]